MGDNLGYWGCMAVACESGGRRPIPLHFRLWSADSPGFVSENEEIKAIAGEITRHTNRRGIFVYDRGGDNIEFYRHFLARSIARMSFRIHDVPEFHFYAIADGASDILKRGRRWRGFDPAETEKEAEASRSWSTSRRTTSSRRSGE